MTRDKTFRVVRAVGSGAWWVYVVGMLTAVRPFGGGWRFMSVEDLELFGHGLGSSRSPRYAEYLPAGLDGPMILAQLAGIVVIAAALAEVAVVRPWIGLATVMVSCASLALVALVMRPPLTGAQPARGGNRRTGRIRSARDLDAAIRVLAESAETVGDDRPLE